MRLTPVPLALVLAMTAPLAAADPAPKPADTRLYELRIYYAAPGKLDALHARFRDHTVKLFEKHGMTNVGYWVPTGENPDRKLVYVLSYPDAAARAASWKAFLADPDWKAAKTASEANGKLVDKMEEFFLAPTDYSPVAGPVTGTAERVFELRWYTATPGNLPPLSARFRDHTVKLFEKHGMTNLWYWNLAKGQKAEDVTLIYFLTHPSEAARNKAFDAFRGDPAWVSVKSASEEKGSLTEAKDGVMSTMLKPTDYSPSR